MNIIERILAAFRDDEPQSDAAPVGMFDNPAYWRPNVAQPRMTIPARRSTPRELANVGYVDISSPMQSGNKTATPPWLQGSIFDSIASSQNAGGGGLQNVIASFIAALSAPSGAASNLSGPLGVVSGATPSASGQTPLVPPSYTAPTVPYVSPSYNAPSAPALPYIPPPSPPPPPQVFYSPPPPPAFSGGGGGGNYLNPQFGVGPVGGGTPEL